MNLKSQKGSITLFVLVSCLFFLASVACVNMYMQSKQVAVDREYRQIKATYEKDINNMDSIYTELSNKNNLTVNFGIPEFDKTQNKVFVNVFINLEYLNINTLKYGWDYDNDLSNLSSERISNWTYVEHQNGENEFIASTELKKDGNDKDIAYYYLCVNIDKKEYCIPISDYTNDGMILHYDGINNVGQGDKKHDLNATTWKNLCEDTNAQHDGVLSPTGITWGNDYLYFDGLDDWVNAGVINTDYQTIEVVVSIDSNKNYNSCIIGDWENGGGGIAASTGKKFFSKYYINEQYYTNDNSVNMFDLIKKYVLTITYDGNRITTYINGEQLIDSTTVSGVIKSNNTVMALGVDPQSNTATGHFLNGKIYSARVYNHALTADEVKQNYNTDKIRFNISD